VLHSCGVVKNTPMLVLSSLCSGKRNANNVA
jgi:hypothetical protein